MGSKALDSPTPWLSLYGLQDPLTPPVIISVISSVASMAPSTGNRGHRRVRTSDRSESKTPALASPKHGRVPQLPNDAQSHLPPLRCHRIDGQCDGNTLQEAGTKVMIVTQL